MSETIFFRFLVSAMFAGAFGWNVFSRFDEEIGSEVVRTPDRQKYLPYLPSNLLPLYFVCLFLGFTILQRSFVRGLEQLASTWFTPLLQISLFYILLLPLLPILRKRISARSCAFLWFIPNYLYITVLPTFQLGEPLWIIRLSTTAFWILVGIWFAGFVIIMLRSVIRHFLFRNQLLADAVPITDSEVLKIWRQELTLANIKKPKYNLFLSSHTSTPLSIGFFKRTTCVVLPHINYTASDLSLIFRHELIHICREDSANKFFTVFCTALCWFNPLIWIGMKRSAEDIELSCDETVLLDAEDSTRNQYANLVLNTSGDDRGFTTCLSSSVSTLRYRLRHIVQKRTKTSGTIAIAVISFVLFMTSGFVGFSYGEHTGAEVIFHAEDGQIRETYEIYGLNTNIMEHNGFLQCYKPDDLEGYLSSLRLKKISGNYSFREFDRYSTNPGNQLLVCYSSETRNFGVEIVGNILQIIPFGQPSTESTYYTVESDINWHYIESLFHTHYIQDPDIHFPPTLDLFTEGNSHMTTHGFVTNYTIDGQPQPEAAWWNDGYEFGLVNPISAEAGLGFSHEPVRPYSITIFSPDGALLQDVSSDQLARKDQIPLVRENAIYHIHVAFEDHQSKIEMQYRFLVEFDAPTS